MTDDLFRDLDGALAPNTLRAYRSDFRRFSRWCRQAGVDPLAASGKDVAAFIEDSAGAASRAPCVMLRGGRTGEPPVIHYLRAWEAAARET